MIIGSILACMSFWIILAIIFRRVVAPNQVHIVQSRKATTSYGTQTENGNVYYEWPAWIPVFGVRRIELPVSNFDLNFVDYTAYDQDRVPFDVDITAFFRIEDTNKAAQRVESFQELLNQLLYIVQGAVRTILASHDIDKIMLERATFGEQFTTEVATELKSWGVVPVKNMELMDIRDAEGSQVIDNIMAKKKSFIEMESRREVATNLKTAKISEIEAAQATDIRRQEAEQLVGERTAEKDKLVGIANEQAFQEIKAQKAITAEKEMAVKRVEQVKQAEITKDEQVVVAEQDKQTRIIKADGQLEAKKKEATGIEVEGKARAEAEKAMQLAPVMAQIELAQEIGDNEGYQKYLVSIEAIAAQKVVGVEQAEALQSADVKVIANAGNTTNGVSKVMDLFTPKGGTNLAGMLEALAQTPVGESILNKLAPVNSASNTETPSALNTESDNATGDVTTDTLPEEQED